jgi:hypothetical protein
MPVPEGFNWWPPLRPRAAGVTGANASPGRAPRLRAYLKDR